MARSAPDSGCAHFSCGKRGSNCGVGAIRQGAMSSTSVSAPQAAARRAMLDLPLPETPQNRIVRPPWAIAEACNASTPSIASSSSSPGPSITSGRAADGTSASTTTTRRSASTSRPPRPENTSRRRRPDDRTSTRRNSPTRKPCVVSSSCQLVGASAAATTADSSARPNPSIASLQNTRTPAIRVS